MIKTSIKCHWFHKWSEFRFDGEFNVIFLIFLTKKIEDKVYLFCVNNTRFVSFQTQKYQNWVWNEMNVVFLFTKIAKELHEQYQEKN